MTGMQAAAAAEALASTTREARSAHPLKATMATHSRQSLARP